MYCWKLFLLFKLQSRLQARGHYFLLFPKQLVQVKKKGCKAYHMKLEQNVVIFLFLQYAILLTIVVTIQMKYVLHIIDLRSENPWDNKAVYLLYTELITGNNKLHESCVL